ncbi:MAG: M3 family metallopeptidase, partial [Thiotrichales bacterium]|nr:M3 family metallopeptidase [Thiotrichales bacterium]
QQTAQQNDLDGWLLTLDFPCYMPVMQYCNDPELRREIYTAYVTRATAEQGNDQKWDNSQVMVDIVNRRQESARLLDYSSYAERSLAKKMAQDPGEVLNFLHELAEKSRPVAQRDLQDVVEYAKQQHGREKLEVWDIAWHSEKLKQARFDFSDEDIRPYFPVPAVLDGLFAVVNRLYGLHITPRHDVTTWHEDVRYFEIFDSNDELQGSFYLDLYARQHKRGGAWMDECIVRRNNAGTIQHPVAYLTCNFTPPVGTDPALITHDEVITLFHEFGHGLHHMLTKVDFAGVAGINGVPWDAVELPSQFMENWCWEREALDLFARHYKTGAALPDELFGKMLAARNFQSGMQMVRQLEFALFDFQLHMQAGITSADQIQSLLDDVRQQVAVIRPPGFNRFQNSFSHIFAGGYAAGYYSYKWAEVLSADAFSRFEEQGIFNPQTGRDFLHSILEQGGSREPMELFIQFRGRKPSVEPLLRQSGITA